MDRARQMRVRRLVARRRGGWLTDRVATLARLVLVGYENNGLESTAAERST